MAPAPFANSPNAVGAALPKRGTQATWYASVICSMRRSLAILSTAVFFACGGLALQAGRVSENPQEEKPAPASSRAYLGFDRNNYPGDASLPLLRKTFSFSGYWLNMPPGEAVNTWQGKRATVASNGFGFLVLFNGRLDRQLKSVSKARMLGARDSNAAAEAAKKEGFPPGTVIFLDQEEGGRMLPEQRAYVYAWIDGINASGFRGGVYCSGMPAQEDAGVTIVTANDLRDNAGGRDISFFVYNDACPPSTGCVFPGNPPPPARSGVSFATIWQFAQSPRRREVTAGCSSRYSADGNCYAPSFQPKEGMHIDLDSAISPDPSSGRR